jgi:serine/threonine protein kinase/WD40 repeat protein
MDTSTIDDGRTVEALDAPLQSGTEIQHFVVIRWIGRGGNGHVYLALDKQLGRKVALKVLRQRDRESTAEFLHEARTTAQFNHPNIVTIHHVGVADGIPFLALEYLDGQTLRQRLREARPGFQEAARIGQAIASALETAHREGVLHRDLKPENVMIQGDGRVRVLDFGLALTFDDADRDHTTAAGTPSYMAPEQWVGTPLSAQTDIWALGVILYEMLSGRRPYEDADTGALPRRVTAPTPIASLSIEKTIPRDLAQLVDCCLDKKAERRPSAQTVKNALMKFFEPARTINEDSAPFIGLLPFVEGQSSLFFGRERETAHLCERLRVLPTLPIVGPSGCGKSSFVRAGVVPRLREQGAWMVFESRPGLDPFANLCARLLFEGNSSDLSGEETLREHQAKISSEKGINPLAIDRQVLRQNPRLLSLALRAIANQAQARVLLFIDQLEELFTLVDDPELQQAYLQAICSAADDHQDPVRVVFTIRDDFLGRLATVVAARPVLAQVTVLHAPDRLQLTEIVERPAKLAGYKYDDPQLVDEIVAEVAGEPACLPMLQSATQLLWDHRDQKKRLLLRSVYERFGGVSGALAAHADSVLSGLSSSERALARELLLQLVTAESTRRVVTRGALLEGLPTAARGLLDRLIHARLLTAGKSSGDHDEAEIELAHESLIKCWRTFARWIEESHEERALIGEIVEAAHLWHRRKRPASELWTGRALQEAQRVFERTKMAVSPTAKVFIDAGRRRAALRRRKRVFAAAAFVLAATGLVVIWISTLQNKERQARDARKNAELQASKAHLHLARLGQARGDPVAARAWLRSSLELRDSYAARRAWLRASQEQLLWRGRFDRRICGMALSHDERTLALAAIGKAVVLLDLETFERRLLPKTAGLCNLAFSPDNKRLLGVNRRSIRIYHLRDQRQSKVEGGSLPLGASWETRFGPDGRTIWSTGSGGVYRFRLGAKSPKRERLSAVGHSQRPGFRFTKRGLLTAWLDIPQTGSATASDSGNQSSPRRFVVYRRGLDGAVLRRVPMPARAPYLAVSISPDGRKALQQHLGVRVFELIDLQGKQAPWRLFARPFNRAVFSADSRFLALAGINTIDVLDVERRARVAHFELPARRIVRVSLTRDRRLIIACHDGQLVIWRWPAARWRQLSRAHRGAALELAFDSASGQLLSGGKGGRIARWRLATGRLISSFAAHKGAIRSLNLSGKYLVTSGDDGFISLWQWPAGIRVRHRLSTAAGVLDLAINRSGTRIASIGGDQRLRLWRLPTLELIRSVKLVAKPSSVDFSR